MIEKCFSPLTNIRLFFKPEEKHKNKPDLDIMDALKILMMVWIFLTHFTLNGFIIHTLPFCKLM